MKKKKKKKENRKLPNVWEGKDFMFSSVCFFWVKKKGSQKLERCGRSHYGHLEWERERESLGRQAMTLLRRFSKNILEVQRSVSASHILERDSVWILCCVRETLIFKVGGEIVGEWRECVWSDKSLKCPQNDCLNDKCQAVVCCWGDYGWVERRALSEHSPVTSLIIRNGPFRNLQEYSAGITRVRHSVIFLLAHNHWERIFWPSLIHCSVFSLSALFSIIIEFLNQYKNQPF